MFIDDALLQGDDIHRIISCLLPSLKREFGIECKYGLAEHGNKREAGLYGKEQKEAGVYGKEKLTTVASARLERGLETRQGSSNLSIFYSREFVYYVNVTMGKCHTAYNPLTAAAVVFALTFKTVFR